MNTRNPSKCAAIVFGGNINGYSIIKELYECKVPNIILVNEDTHELGNYSRLYKKRIISQLNETGILETLQSLRKEYDYLVLFPSHDKEIEPLSKLYDQIIDYCFIPFNPQNIINALKKEYQYEKCKELGIPIPQTIYINSINEFSEFGKLRYPMIIKPTTRHEGSGVFRNLVCNSEIEFNANEQKLKDFLNSGITFIASEIIPGDGSNIYAHVAYRSYKGEILNEWIGKKLSQFPNDFGVFASASNECPDIVQEQGKILLDGMDLWGINEPEFKYDARDDQYKLMEINTRSMMWHRTGNLSGVNIQYTQWLDAINSPIQKQKQIKDKTIHYVYLQYELINLFARKKYWKTFKHSLWGGDSRYFAESGINEIRPFIFSMSITFLRIFKRCLKLSKQ